MAEENLVEDGHLRGNFICLCGTEADLLRADHQLRDIAPAWWIGQERIVLRKTEPPFRIADAIDEVRLADEISHIGRVRAAVDILTRA